MDNRIGNSGGLGGLFGIMVGVGLPAPGSLRFLVYTLFIRLQGEAAPHARLNPWPLLIPDHNLA